MPSTTYTTSSGSGRVRVYQESEVHSSRSGSIHSPASTSDSFSSSTGSEGWTEIDQDDIEPSDSASRSRPHARSRRHTTEARPAPTRRHSSRRIVVEHAPTREREPDERHHSSHRHRSSRHYRTEPRRAASDESTSTVASHGDHPYSHHGMPPPRGYGYRHVPAPSQHGHGGYPPSMTSHGGPYPPDAFNPQALVHMPQHDAFGYPSSNPNPFAPGGQQNPFSPAPSSTSGYFPNEPPVQRPPGPGHRSSMYGAPPSGLGYGSEMVPSPYQHPAMQGMPPGWAMHGYPPYPYQYPPSHGGSPPPPAEERKHEQVVKEVIVEKPIEKKEDPMSKEMEALRELIKKHEEERIAREKAMIAKAEADAAEAAAKKAKEEEAKKKAEEIAAASAAAKEAAEKAAEEAAKKAKEESDKKLAESEKAKEAAEKKKKELEDEIKKNKPAPDMLKAPIKFKDAVGRKFSFPWHLCKTWKGMEGLIKQAFLHVDLIGQHVQEGHYDLCGPDGEIILPQVWETMIQPDWEISMHMWPMPELKSPKKDKLAEDAAMVETLGDPFAALGIQELLAMDPKLSGAKKSDKKAGKTKNKRSSTIVEVPPQAPPAPPPPPTHLPPGFADLLGQPPGMVVDVGGKPSKGGPSKGKAKGKELSPFAAWIAGSRPAKKGDEKLGSAGAIRRRSTASSAATGESVGSVSQKSAAAAQQGSCSVM